MSDQICAPEPVTRTFVSMWLGFCVLMVLVGLQEHWTAGLPGQGWRPTRQAQRRRRQNAITLSYRLGTFLLAKPAP